MTSSTDFTGKIIHQKQEELGKLQVMCKVVLASGLVSFFSDRQSVLQVKFWKSYCNNMAYLMNNRSIKISVLLTCNFT